MFIIGICIAVVSGKGGTGKSTVSCSLATQFYLKGKTVLVVDLDTGLKCQDIFFGIDKDVVFDLSDALESGNYSDSIYRAKDYKNNVFIVPAPALNKKIDNEAFGEFIKTYRSQFDVIIIDMPAGLDFSPLFHIDGISFLCVTNPDPISVRDAYAVKNALKGYADSLHLIINKFDGRLIKNGAYGNIDDMIDISGIKLLGIIPYSDELMLLPVTHKLKKRGKAFKAIERIRERIWGASIPLPNPDKI